MDFVGSWRPWFPRSRIWNTVCPRWHSTSPASGGLHPPVVWKWLKTNYLPLFKFSPPFPSLSLPAAKGIYQSFQSAGMSDRTAWSTSAHMSSHNYSRMRRVSTCKQDSTVELLVLLTHIQSSFFKIMGRPYRNHHLLPRGGTAVTACCVENIRCYTQIFPYHNIWKKCTTCRLCLAIREKTHIMLHVGLFHWLLKWVWHESGRRWSLVNKLRQWWSPRLSRSILWPSPAIWIRGRGLKNNRAPRKAKREGKHTISHGNGRFTIVIFSYFFFRLPFKELALQVSESDSWISILLY